MDFKLELQRCLTLVFGKIVYFSGQSVFMNHRGFFQVFRNGQPEYFT